MLLRSRLPLREVEEVLLAGLLVWPLRWLTAAVAGFALRVPLARWPFVGRAGEWVDLPFPFALLPLVGLALVLLAPFALQRVLVLGLVVGLALLRAPVLEPLAGRAEVRLDDSELGRRAVRLAEAPCAGLRSRECAAGRLKCGRADAVFCGATALCEAAGRGA